MSWQTIGNRCTKEEFEDFRRELDALQNSRNRSQKALVAKIEFESKWIGHCIGCGRVIPVTKTFCPWCDEA